MAPLPIPRFRSSLSAADLLAGLLALRPSAAPERPVAEFEAAFAAATGRRHAVAAPSARAALAALLPALGLGEGDEVLFPAWGYFAMPAAARAAGLQVRFADVSPDGFLLDPDAVAAAITPRTRIVVPTHLYGQVCDLDGIEAAARAVGALVVEDGAQALGAAWRGRPVGASGVAGVFTLGVTKHVTALSGGVVVTDDEGIAARVRARLAGERTTPAAASLRQLATGAAFAAASAPPAFAAAVWPPLLAGDLAGRDLLERFFGEEPDPLAAASATLPGRAMPGAVQAAVGRSQLSRLAATAEARRRAGRALAARLRDVPGLTVPREVPGSDPIYSSFATRVRGQAPEVLGRRLRRRGIDCTRGFMQDCASLPWLGGDRPGGAPHAASAAAEVLHLPLHGGLGEGEIDRIARAVEEECRRLA
ncbi:aminotransferase class V-fold PLP-dependent enzyme [Myxococcota bacterium]|nr:aminotransferase class V-fold PLP-dependent enzyme [Myxococcota bacterium]